MQQQSSGYINRELSYSKIVHNLARGDFVKKVNNYILLFK